MANPQNMPLTIDECRWELERYLGFLRDSTNHAIKDLERFGRISETHLAEINSFYLKVVRLEGQHDQAIRAGAAG